MKLLKSWFKHDPLPKKTPQTALRPAAQLSFPVIAARPPVPIHFAKERPVAVAGFRRARSVPDRPGSPLRAGIALGHLHLKPETRTLPYSPFPSRYGNKITRCP